MAKKKISLQEIADSLGISKVSVSKALNGQPGIGPEMRQKVIATARELGYVMTRTANRDGNEKFAFFVLKRNFVENENFYTSIYYYLNKYSQKHNQELSTFVITNAEERGGVLPKTAQTGGFNGIYVAGEFEDSFLCRINELGSSVVTIDYRSPRYAFDSVQTDNFFNGYAVSLYLIERGHRNIGFVGGTGYTSNVTDRFYGYRKALAEYGLNFDERNVIVNVDKETGLYSMDFGLPEVMPDAFVCHCDMAAYFLMQKLRACGLSVPGDVSVISFDNTVLGEKCALTTMEISKSTMAAEALSAMTARLANLTAPPRRIYVATKLIERDTVRQAVN